VEQTDLWPVVVGSTDKAIDFARGEQCLPDLIIIDYALVGENLEGLQRMRTYRKRRQAEPTPILIANKELLVILADRWLQVLERPVTYTRLKAVLRENSTPRRRREKKPGRQGRGSTQGRTT